MLNKLTNSVYYMPQNAETDKPALGLICGNKCSVIVDSGSSPAHAMEFLEAVKKLNVPPVKFVIITHWHWDHVFGIKDMGITTIGHKNTRPKLRELQAMTWDDKSLDRYVEEKVFSEFNVSCIKNQIPDRSSFSIGDLDVMFEDSMEIDLGGITCIIKHVGGDHTPDSSIVYVPEEKVMFLGDCIYGSRYNGVYGYTKEKLHPMIEYISSYEAEHYIISHEELFTKEQIDKLWDELRTAEQTVGDGTSTEEALQAFENKHCSKPSQEIAYFIKCFAEVNKALRG